MTAYEKLREDCIVSPYTPKPHGYCQVKIKGKNYLHHRLAYAAHIGVGIEAIADVLILHKCDNRRCINPLHLVAGSHQDNKTDKVNKGRQSRLVGAANKAAKLTDVEVVEIRKLLAADRHSQRDIAKLFNIAQNVVFLIAYNKAWKHI